MKTLTLNRPFALGQFTVIMVNLQHTLIYHNTQGLVAIIVEHKQMIYIDENMSNEIIGGLDVDAFPLVLGDSFDTYKQREVSLKSTKYFVEIKATPVHDDLASNDSDI